ncbi:MAG: hypothetical protein HQ483_02630 [Rhodospirillales bacterium]|nr:hypothetical protein [Rhodospirillales bacterium]
MVYKGRKKSTGKTRRGGAKRVVETVELTLRVNSLGRHCDGVATVEGAEKPQTYFVPFALPGEQVRVRAAGNRAELVEILQHPPTGLSPFAPITCNAAAVSPNIWRMSPIGPGNARSSRRRCTIRNSTWPSPI